MSVVLTEKHSPQITIITLNRPERRNALSIQLLTELIASIKLASDETRERILILRGAGGAFCTGLRPMPGLERGPGSTQGAGHRRFVRACAWRNKRGASSDYRCSTWGRRCRW